MPKPTPAATTANSTAVERALSILELVVQKSEGLTNSEISRQLTIPKSSASYLLRTLEDRGYLRRDQNSHRYRIGIKVASLAHGMLEFVDLRQAASPVLRQLVEKTGLTAHLAILDNGRAVYIDRAENPGFLRINTWVGRDLNVHATAVGKALMAHREESEVRDILDKQGMEQKTHRTVTTAAEYLLQLEQVRTLGFAEDIEENNLGVRCVGAPVFDAGGQGIAAIGLTGAISQVTSENAPNLAKVVVKAASIVSRQLGFAGAR